MLSSLSSITFTTTIDNTKLLPRQRAGITLVKNYKKKRVTSAKRGGRRIETSSSPYPLKFPRRFRRRRLFSKSPFTAQDIL
ncbi:hypothetical protein L484_005523 [Morus notabilis]|uniref:Uncharacterized protein n=1 Tax=Morus notabilis TaxID=981085 RepID=W9QMB3_9ROSA|nr:hypothetical protein L484_005523 [Morus notabilis]